MKKKEEFVQYSESKQVDELHVLINCVLSEKEVNEEEKEEEEQLKKKMTTF